MAPPNRRLAVLVDADNAQAALIQPLLREVARFGVATVKRVYGDWTTSHLKAVLRTNPDFEGVKQLGKLVRAKPFLEVKSVPCGQSTGTAHLYVRLKEAANSA
jgi:hypothetical protein